MASRRRVQPRGAQVVRRVLDCTLHELSRVGLARLSVARVARQAKVNKTSVYRRWPTKRALAQAALAHALEQGEPIGDLGSLEAELLALTRRVAGFLSSPAGAAVVRTLFVEDATALRTLARKSWGGQGAEVAAIVARARARRELTKTDDVELLFFSLAGALLHRRVVEDATLGEHWLRRVVRFHLRALG
ncbi:MAG: TetR-like C-terminal domain-containing protein [Myxococcaceae bacterium]